MGQQFQKEFHFDVPESYLRVLRVCDGLNFDGLTIWPTHAHGPFEESLIDANSDLRENMEESLVYFGQRDDILFVFDKNRQGYAALEMLGLAEWLTFVDAETMILFMLQQVVGEDGDDD